MRRGLVHFLTGHGPYPKNLHRFGRKDTPMCDCGELGSPENKVYACTLSGPDIMKLRAQLGGEDTAEALRSPENDLARRERQAAYTAADDVRKWHGQ